MDKILNPVLAPFSTDRADKTSVPAIAVAYCLIGLAVGVFVLKG